MELLTDFLIVVMGIIVAQLIRPFMPKAGIIALGIILAIIAILMFVISVRSKKGLPHSAHSDASPSHL